MEPFFDEIEEQEEREYQKRRAKRQERMRLERRQEEKRRRMLKKILIAGGVGFLVVMIAIIVPDKKTNTEDTQNQAETANSISQMEGTEITEQWEDETTENAVVTEAEETLPVYAFKETAETVSIQSEQVISANAILIDESTDTIIASKGANEIISPASMTKVLTVLVAAEHIAPENLDDTFTMTLEITDYAYVNECSTVGFLNEEVITVRDLFYGTILPSGGEAAVGLATYAAGSHEAFVTMMNEKLAELGLSETAHFTNCVGLYDENHYCSVYDMAIIMKAAMQNEWCREVLTTRTYTTTPTEQHPEGITISNWFIRRIEDKDTGGQVIGAKTGYVKQSGSCAVSYGLFGSGTPYICVTAGSTTKWRCINDHVEIYKSYVPTE